MGFAKSWKSAISQVVLKLGLKLKRPKRLLTRVDCESLQYYHTRRYIIRLPMHSRASYVREQNIKKICVNDFHNFHPPFKPWNPLCILATFLRSAHLVPRSPSENTYMYVVFVVFSMRFQTETIYWSDNSRAQHIHCTLVVIFLYILRMEQLLVIMLIDVFIKLQQIWHWSSTSCSLCSRLEMRCSKCEKVSAGRHDMADWLSAEIEAKSFSGLPSGKMVVFTSVFLALGRDWLNQSWAKYHGFLKGWKLGHHDIVATWWLRAFCWSQVHNVTFSWSWFTNILLWLSVEELNVWKSTESPIATHVQGPLFRGHWEVDNYYGRRACWGQIH